MANTSTARAAINSQIKTNGNGEITASVLNGVLTQMCDAQDATEATAARDALTLNGGARIDEKHICNISGSTATYGANASYDAIHVAIMDGVKALQISGAVVSRYCYYSALPLTQANYVGNNLTGNVPTGAKYCVINALRSSNPNYESLLILQSFDYVKTSVISYDEPFDVRTANKGAWIDYGHLYSVDGTNSKYIANSSWDACHVRVREYAKSIEISGAVVRRYSFFSALPVNYANFVSSNATGEIPEGAVYCVANLSKADNTGGYENLLVKFASAPVGKVLRVLAVGNSYTQDALAYTPYIMANVAPGVKYDVLNLYQSGATLANHWTNYQNATAAYAAHRSTNGGAWVSLGTKSIQDALSLAEWNVILWNQGSTSAATLSSYQPYLNNLINAVFGAINYPVKHGFVLCQSRPKINTTDLTDAQILTNYNSISSAVQSIVGSTLIDFVIPIGTAVQNARATSLNSLGDYGKLTYEGAHLQEGLPCQLAAYTSVLTFLDLIGEKNRGVFAEKTRATASYLANKGIPGPNGSSVGVTEENVLKAQKCAIMAHKFPYQVSSIPE